MSGIEPIADAVTGGIVARTVEPRADGAAGASATVGPDGHTHESRCLNCGASLLGEYCQDCGQRAHVHRSLHAFAHDLLHGVFHFEGKIWRTLPMLAWRPGELTRRYIEGERASFVSPIALFLFCVFLMFAVVGSTAKIDVLPQGRTEIVREEAKAKERVATLEAERREAMRAGRPTAAIDSRLADAREDEAMFRRIEELGIVGGSMTQVSSAMPSWLGHAVEKAGKNPDLLFYKLKTNAYKYGWMLIPLSVPFMWLLFVRQRRRYRLYDHTVFVTYSLCFMALLVVIASILTKAGLGSLASVLWLIPPVHMFRQLKGAYGLSPGLALLKTLALIGIAGIASTLFLAILLALGIF